MARAAIKRLPCHGIIQWFNGSCIWAGHPIILQCFCQKPIAMTNAPPIFLHNTSSPQTAPGCRLFWPSLIRTWKVLEAAAGPLNKQEILSTEDTHKMKRFFWALRLSFRINLIWTWLYIYRYIQKDYTKKLHIMYHGRGPNTFVPWSTVYSFHIWKSHRMALLRESYRLSKFEKFFDPVEVGVLGRLPNCDLQNLASTSYYTFIYHSYTILWQSIASHP